MTTALEVARMLELAVAGNVGSVLVFDASYATLAPIAESLENELAARHRAVRRVHLSGRETDDALFGGLALRGGDTAAFAPRPGVIEPAPGEVVLAVVPDLSRIGLDLRRAILATTAGGLVHVERQYQQRSFEPHIWWLAACPLDRVGAVSPHLVDRFAVRVHPDDTDADKVEALRRFVDDGEVEPSPRTGADPGVVPAIQDEMIEAVCRQLAPHRGAGLRRYLTLARIAIAAAQRAGLALVTASHVAEAAELLGLSTPAPIPVGRPTAGPEAGAIEPVVIPGPATVEKPVIAPRKAAQVDAPLVAAASDADPAAVAQHTVSRIASTSALASPYVEDSAPVMRDPTSLRPPPGPGNGAAPGRGAVVGTMSAGGFVDLAVVASLFEAAKRRATRRLAGHLTGRGLSPADLRRYRRSPPPGALLVIVLDHTALEGWRWDLGLTIYLREAYVRRAAVTLIQVGASAGAGLEITAEDLRARQLHVRNVRARALFEALGAGRGRATPLAHGLSLALDTIRTAATRGRGRPAEVQLVVVTDGRANVPLLASQAGELCGRVGTEGIRDALEVATRLQELRGVESVVLHGRPETHPDLPARLASALGGTAKAVVARGRG